MMGFWLQRFNDLSCQRQLAVAREFVNGQIDLRRRFFLLPFNFLLRENYG
jgi:hypothetical protein